ncbi:MAG: YcxB family protein [Candidatus Caccosoma sp.]|nr:YcxB family protein [Candidatus Caccosoma sp.]
MYKFDVRYNLKNYYEYYKFLIIKQRFYRDMILSLVFFGIAIYWFVDTTENTNGILLPIFAIIMGILFPLMNFITFPMIKKQLRARQKEIENTHLTVTFNDDEVVYENLTEKLVDEIKETNEVKNEEASVENGNNSQSDEEERIFKLNYVNFMRVNETKGLFLFYLDRQTVIILPKETFIEGSSLNDFKEFILTKIDKKRVRFIKEKN